MRIQVLGPVAVSTPDGSVLPAGRQLGALLALLAVRAPREARSDFLIEALWGGPRSPAALRVLVLRLRRLLADAGAGDVLLTTAGGYRLALTPTDIDAGEADALVTAAREARAGGDTTRALQLLRDASSLWHGEPFGGVDDLDALRPHAERLAALHLDALEHEGACLVELGEHEVAAAMLRPLAREHPLRERFTGLLMLALARAGRSAEGLRAYGELRQRLAEDLGLVPCDDLQRLERELLLPGSEPQAVASVVRAGVPVPSPSRPEGEVPGVLRVLRDGTFVGRDADLDRLAGHLLGATAEGPVAVLTGEPGIGKTRLAAEVAHLAASRGLAVLYGSCSASGGDGQEPIADLLHHLAEVAPPPHRDELVALASEDPRGVDLAADAALRRAHLQGALRRALAALGRQGALVVLDDVHWVRAGGGRLLEVLVQERPPGIAWLLLARSTEATDDGLDVLVSLARSRALAVDLGPLPDDAVEALSRQHLSTSGPGAALAPVVVARSGGNPLFAVELARYLRTGGDPAGAPPDLRSMVSRLLGRLGPDAHRLAQLLALGGPTCPLDAAARVAGLDDLRAAEVADALTAAGVLVGWGTGGGSFRHPVIAQAVADDVGAALALQLRAGLGATLDPAEPATAVLRADLLLAARSVVPTAEVHRAVQQAVQRLLRRGWYEAAESIGRRYLELVPPGITATPEEVVARLAVATALLAAGRSADGVQLLDEAGAAAEVLRQPELTADAILARGPLGARRVRPQDVARFLAVADALDPSDGSRRIQLLCWAAHHLMVMGDPDRATELLDQATALLPLEPTATMRVLLAGMRYQLDAGVRSTPARAAAAHDAITRLAAGTDYLPAQVLAHLFGLTQALRQHGLDDFHRRIEQLRDGTRRVPRPDLVWWVEGATATEALARGRLDEAASLVDHADQVGRRLHVVHARPISMLHQLLLQWEEGRLGDLAPLLRPNDDGQHPLSWLVAALASLEAGQIDEAADAVRRSGRPRLVDTGEQWPHVAMLAGQVCWRLDEGGWAGEVFAELAPHRGTALGLHGLGYLGSVDAHLGRLAAARGDLAAAVDLLTSGADQERRWGADLWAARSLVDAATVLRTRRDPGDQRRADELERQATAGAPPDGR